MKDIDFLPIRYRERSRLRRVMIWRIAIVSSLVAIMLAVHIGQMAVRRALRHDLDQLAAAHRLAVETSARLQQMQTELAGSEQYAELYTYLQHPWPRTQLLAAITQTLPSKLMLTEIQIAQVLPPNVASAPPSATTPADSEIPPGRRDLNKLREEHDKAITTVTLHGTTSDAAALQQYVAGFNRSPFFATAKLESLESLKAVENNSGSQFELRLVVKPGYGQPGGPNARETLAQNTAAPRSTNNPAEAGP